MPNGDCIVGVKNSTRIDSAFEKIKLVSNEVADLETQMNKRMTKIESKQDWMIYLLIINLVTVIVSYLSIRLTA